MLVSEQGVKSRKRSKLRHCEYYDMQGILDELYFDSKEGKIFENLMEIIKMPENIKLAYRNIKNNLGSTTHGVDKVTISSIKGLKLEEYVDIIERKLTQFVSKPVRRVEIPKANGKLRPLGIPSMWDRLVQQCILQVLEPICEAKFSKHSFGFRPNRSAKHAIAQAHKYMQNSNLYFVVDIDVKGFFDNVNHTKLVKQMWEMGIRDKKLLSIIKSMLKAPIKMPNGEIKNPEYGTPQGGIISPLLSNIVLNELDWWITSQWEDFYKQMKRPVKTMFQKDGSRHLGNDYRALKTTRLKEMRIVRYADDFKIFCRTKSDANKVFIAVKRWLKERLKLKINEEKSRIVNLKRKYSEFLGIKLKVVPKRNKYVVRSHIADKALVRIKDNLTNQVKKIQRPKTAIDINRDVTKYNSMVMGIQNYYNMATCVSLDLRKIALYMNLVIKGRLWQGYSKDSKTCKRSAHIFEKYKSSKQTRFMSEYPIAPIGYVKFKIPLPLKNGTNAYTQDGRNLIYKNLGVDTKILRKLMQKNEFNRSIEYSDNRISVYTMQNGKCMVTKKPLEIDDIHCHHKKPISIGGTDEFSNLVILSKKIHILVHATEKETIEKYSSLINPDKKQLDKINKLRKILGNVAI